MWRIKSYKNPAEEPFGLFLILKVDTGLWENAGRILQWDYLAGGDFKAIEEYCVCDPPTRATGAAAAIACYDAGRGSTW